MNHMASVIKYKIPLSIRRHLPNSSFLYPHSWNGGNTTNQNVVGLCRNATVPTMWVQKPNNGRIDLPSRFQCDLFEGDDVKKETTVIISWSKKNN